MPSMAMDVTPAVPAGRQLIQGYGDGGFTISGTSWTGSVLILPEQTQNLAVGELSALSADAVPALLEATPRPEILLVGCGRSMGLVPKAFREAVRAAGIFLEPMDTGAACRTFNVLLAEERRVAAVMIAV